MQIFGEIPIIKPPKNTESETTDKWFFIIFKRLSVVKSVVLWLNERNCSSVNFSYMYYIYIERERESIAVSRLKENICL